jgi:hypothetical protein
MANLPPRPVTASYELAFEEVLRSIGRQDQVLDNLRTRAGVLLSATAIVTSFFGSQVLRQGRLSPSAWIAICLFILLAVEVGAWVANLATIL